MALQEMLN